MKPMNNKEFQNTIDTIFCEEYSSAARTLNSVANAELSLGDSYQGRYFFELLQNARDCGKKADKRIKVKIVILEDRLLFANTGAGFNAEGIDSICSIGESTKADKSYIGHKGIGFKSILNISDTPRIITKWGSINFDRQITSQQYHEDGENPPKNMPLFSFPHFYDKTVNECVENGLSEYETIIELPYKKGINGHKVEKLFEGISNQDLIMLGYIKNIQISSNENEEEIIINKYENTNKITIKTNKTFSAYKVFSKSYLIPQTIFTQLSDKEQQLFEKDPNIDIKIVAITDEDRQMKRDDAAKLFLFYPLDIYTGFGFIIHSYFSVNPARKRLMESELNNFILDKVAHFIANELLDIFKKQSQEMILDMFRFIKNEGNGLDRLYSKTAKYLKNKKFIPCNGKFYRPDEIILGDDDDLELFQTGRINNMYILSLENDEIIQWLKEEFDVKATDEEYYRGIIEDICGRNINNIDFLNCFYRKLKDWTWDFRDKKIILTSNNELVSGDEHIYLYSQDIEIPDFLKDRIYLANKNLDENVLEESAKYTGVKDLTTNDLLKTVIEIFEKESSINRRFDMISFIKSISSGFDENDFLYIKENMQVPVSGGERIKSLDNPVYIPNKDLKELYPEGYFINTNLLKGYKENPEDWNDFLRKCGIWDRPALYVEKHSYAYSGSLRCKKLRSISGLSESPFSIKNGVNLNWPKKISKSFFNYIICNWQEYVNDIISNKYPWVCFYNSRSSEWGVRNKDRIFASGFLQSLNEKPWIYVNDAGPFSCAEIIALDSIEYEKSRTVSLKKYFNVIKYDTHTKDLVKTLDIIFYNADTRENYIRLLELVYDKYAENIPQKKDFVEAYKKILKYISNFYESIKKEEEKKWFIEAMCKNKFLCISEGDYIWAVGKEIIYINNNFLFRQFSEEIQKLIKPVYITRDNAGFGKIASKIGIKFTDIIKRSLNKPVIKNKTMFLRQFFYLGALIPFIEQTIDNHLKDDDIADLFDTSIVICESISVNTKIDMGSKKLITSKEKYFYKKGEVFILESEINNSSFWAVIIQEYLENITLHRRLDNFDFVIKAIIFAKNQAVIDKLFFEKSIDEDRYQNIMDAYSEKYPVKHFWNNILTIIGKIPAADFFKKTTLDTDLLAEISSLDPGVIKSFDESFNYRDYSDYKNIKLLKDLFFHLKIELGDFNERGSLVIDFREYHENELNKVKNMLRKKIFTVIYREMKAKMQFQNKFYDIEENYDTVEFKIDDNTLFMNYMEVFSEQINKYILEFDLDISELTNTETVNISKIYENNFNKLSSKIIQAEKSTEHLNDFLKSNKIRSRLLFGKVQEIYKDYINYIQIFGEVEEKEDDFTPPVNREEDPDFTPPLPPDPTKPTPPGPPGGSGGDDADKEKTGFDAEYRVFMFLKGKYRDVKWVSENAAKANMGNAVKDDKGYDMEYIDLEGVKKLVEVKGSKANPRSFLLTENQIRKGLANRKIYEIVYVAYASDDQKYQIRTLGNIFDKYNSLEDLLNDPDKNFKITMPELRFRFK